MQELRVIKGHLFQQTESQDACFNSLYLRLRKLEGRIYTNREVLELPHLPASHPLHGEWLKRTASCQRLLRYLVKRPHIRDVLEIGCGNGWLTAQLAAATKGSATGIDINRTELDQARKVFGKLPRLHFCEGDIRTGFLEEKRFDLVVFAASIQYFPSVREIIERAFMHLTLEGEIHLLDSHFYDSSQLAAARERSKLYFISRNVPEMTHFYFHHHIRDLSAFRYRVLFNPGSVFQRLKRNKSPFPWILIKNPQY